MREIKFRAWDKKEKRMISTKEFCFSPYFIQADGKVINMDSSAPLVDEYGDGSNRYDELPYELMMWTGLFDKNGKEIYEGDVVKYGSDCSEVKYGEFNCSCCDGVYGWYFDGGDIRECDRYEVIGNVMENPDLLNK